jgi:hypothetical protein
MHQIRTVRRNSCSCPRFAGFFLWTALLSVSFHGTAVGQAPPPADLAIGNAQIWSGMHRRKPGTAEPTAVAVIGDTIVAVGNDAQIQARIGPNTKVIDAQGRRVIPGITDSHVHLVSGGFSLVRLSLRDVRSREEFVRAVEGAAKSAEEGDWVRGRGWSVESWDKPESPKKAWLDPVTGDKPAFLNRMDGHQAIVNSAALKLAGIDRNGPADPVGGEIERDPATREPTGILKESAMGLVSKFIPEPTAEARLDALLRAANHANSLGVTSAHDMSDLDDVPAFREAARLNLLTVRITAFVSVSDWPAHLDRVVKLKEETADDAWVRVAGFKGYMDGSLGSRTAYMREPFADSTPNSPYPRGQRTAFASSPTFKDDVLKADAAGLQLAVHAIGDEACHLLLDAYEAAARRDPKRRGQHRVEHTQHLLINDVTRFQTFGVVASMQPFHKADDGRYAEAALGSDRLKGSYAFRLLHEMGALVIFGSDWPVVTLNPFAGIHAAVTGRTLAGNVWMPSNSLPVTEALRCYTVNPPRAVHQDNRLGSIEEGKLADVVILQQDPLVIDPDRLAEVKVAYTIVGGKVVYRAPGEQ